THLYTPSLHDALPIFGERDRLEAALGVAAHLGRGQLRIEQPRQLARNDPAWVRAGPFVEVPVVPRPYRRQRELGIAADLDALARSEERRVGNERSRQM